MPPSASAATRSDSDDVDHAPSSSNSPVTEISDSDMDIDDDDDDRHEAVVEEEEDPEKEEVDGSDNDDEKEIEEEEIVEEDDGEEDANEKRNDISHDAESEKPLGSHCTPQMSRLRDDSVCNFKCADPSDEALITQKEKQYGDHADSRSPKLSKHLVVSGGNAALESKVNKTDVEALRLLSLTLYG